MAEIKENKEMEKVQASASTQSGERKKTEVAKTKCEDKNCPTHGNLKARGRIFRGKVIRKFPKRIVIEFERVTYISKYERYQKKKTKIHARLPDCMEQKIGIGDQVEVKECRPLSKLVHFVVIKNIGEGKK